MSLFNMQKTTPCGRFTVRIESQIPEGDISTAQDYARSLKNLADLLTAGADHALHAAVALLESKGVGR